MTRHVQQISLIFVHLSPCELAAREERLTTARGLISSSRIVVATFLSTSILVNYMLGVLISKFNGRRLASKKTFRKYNAKSCILSKKARYFIIIKY